MQCTNDCPKGDGGKDDSRESSPKHPLCPFCHSLLGVKVAAFTVVLALTIFSVFRSYKAADRAFDAIERGRYACGFSLLLAALILGPTAAIGLPGGGYWLIFEGGFCLILGLP